LVNSTTAQSHRPLAAKVLKNIIMKSILLGFIVLNLASCKTLMMKRIFKDPKVENTQTIKDFQTKNNFSTENSLIIKADTTNAIQKLFLGMTIGYYIFDKAGNQVCYNASSTCQGYQFKQLLDNKIDSFKSCKNDTATLEKVLKETYDLEENSVEKKQFGDSDYYVVTYWQKFLGGKRGYEEAVVWMEDEIKKNKSTLKFTFIKINTDLQENWGLATGKKATLKYKQKDGFGTLEVLNLPIKR
jgi:hypothetical protein